MDGETVRGLGTLLLLVSYVGLCAWAFWPGNRRRFEEAAQLPFRDERDGGAR